MSKDNCKKVDHKSGSYTFGQDCAYKPSKPNGWLPLNFWRETIMPQSARYAEVSYPKHEDTRTQDDTNRQIADWTASVARYTSYLVFVGIATTLVGFATLIVIFKQWNEMIGSGEQAERTIAIAKAQQKNFIVAQRASVYFNGFEAVPNGNIINQWAITPSWINTGGTPTKFLALATFCAFDTFNRDYPPQEIAKQQGKNFSVLGNKQATTGPPCLFLVNDERIRLVNSKRLVMHFAGRACYKDLFEKKWRLTEFSGRFESFLVKNNGVLDFNLIVAADHNCADRQCEDYVAACNQAADKEDDPDERGD